MAYELIKVSELPELTTPSGPNVIPIQDGDYLKRISFENLKEAATEDVADDLAAEVTARESAVSGEATARGNADTAILADLASPYSASATYAVGDYCTKDGQLYRCTTAITTAEAWTAAHWSAVALGDDTRDLRSALSSLIPTNLAAGTTYTSGKGVQYDNGALRNGSSAAATDYISLDGIASIVYTRFATTSTSNVTGVAFYDTNKEYVSGIRVVLGAEAYSYVLETVDVPEGAKYIRMTEYPDYGKVELYDAADYMTKLQPQIDKNKEDIQTVASNVSDLDYYVDGMSKNGYFQIDVSKWALNGWQSYSSTDSRKYRVHCKVTLQFDRDIFILADTGYYVGGYKSDGTGIGGGTLAYIPANTSFKLYVRRFTEDTSEVISDIAPFVNAVKFSTALAPIELYKPTFTDVSMFERVGIGGDSYSAGGGIISGITALTWGKNLERQAGINVDIYAKSGETIVGWNSDQTKGLPALLAGEECGLYWLWHGINGTASAEALGTPEDMSASPRPNTFYGQYVEAIEQIKTAFPNARIVIATVTGSSFGLSQSSYKNANIAIKNIAEYCQIPCIDITEDDFYRTSWYANNCRSNHPTAMLAAGMAMAHRRLISKCIQDNPSYFVNYGAT